MLKKRIIPCLDVREGKVVKGIQFQSLSVVGDPVAMAAFYASQGADELVFYDITASSDRREIDLVWVSAVAEAIDIPFTVGGGIRSLQDFYDVLGAGADKVSINSAVFSDPELISEASQRFGNQCVVLSLDVKRESDGRWQLYKHGGRIPTGLEPIAFVKEMVPKGVGEIVVNAIHTDGMGSGYDLELIREIAKAVSVPVIASGGAGTIDSIAEAFIEGQADAALMASALHNGLLTLPSIKQHLTDSGIPMRNSVLSLFDTLSPEQLLPVIIQDHTDQTVLMLGYMNREAFETTLRKQQVCFYSRSRERLWTKGETSGNTLTPVSIHEDCDADTLLIRVKAKGPTCHTSNRSCFDPLPMQSAQFLKQDQASDLLDRLFQTIQSRKTHPLDNSYTQYLFEQGLDKILKKVGEETAEVIIAAKNLKAAHEKRKKPPQQLAEEVSDLIYHLWVMLAELDVPPEAIWQVLSGRSQQAH